MFKRYRYTEGLTNLHGSNGKYLINYLGEIFDAMGHPVETSIDSDGHRIVTVDGYLGNSTYRVIDLMVFQYKRPAIPDEDYSKVQAFVLNGDKSDVQAKNVGYRFAGGKLEVGGNPGYFYIPMYTLYAINIEGVVIRVGSGIEMPSYITKARTEGNVVGGYHCFGLYCDHGKQSTLGRHRALGLVFFDYPDCVDNWVVNHIDGVPGNDDLGNLEWVSRGRNNTHAYENDLKNQHKRVLVRDVLTGEVVEYYSLSECARQLGYPCHETISFRLRSEFSKVFQDGKQFKYKDDHRDWIIPDDPKRAIEVAIQAIAIKVRCCKTLVESHHGSSGEASSATGAKRATILYRISKDDRSPLRGFQFALAEDDRPWPKFTQDDYIDTLEPSARGVDARNLLTGETEYFPSISRAHTRFKGDVPVILRSGKQVLRPDGWQLKLEGDVFEEISDVDNQLYSLRSVTMAKNVETGDVVITDSSRQMAKHLGLDPKGLRKAALTRGKDVYRGFRFKLGTDEPWPL